MAKKSNKRHRRKSMKTRSMLSIIFIAVVIFYGAYLHEELNTPNVGGYGGQTSNTAMFGDIEVNERLLNIFYFDVGQADSTLIMSARKNYANRCR